MSTMSTVSPSRENTTAEQFSLFARDVNDKLLVLYNNINFGIQVLTLVLGFVVVVSSLKKLSELAHSSTDSETKNPTKDSWVVRKLKSKYAAPLVICGNGSILFFWGALQFLIYFDVGGEAVCDPIQRLSTSLYFLSLWTTYVIFEIRRISTGTENFKGMKYWIMHAVRFGTLCMPAFLIVAYFATSGIYLADVEQCILVFDPTIAIVFGGADTMLSMGHIMLFIFAVRQKSNFKVAVVSSGNKVKPSAASTPYVKGNLALMNRDLASPQDDPASKIKAIARRNFRLALATVASTTVSMGVVYLANSALPPLDLPSARSYLYLGHVNPMAGAADLIVNSLSILLMTSAWQPACLKKLTTKVTAAAAYKQEEESDVSTLGGGS